jgi:predicted transcriptional regulator of viral defense system
MNEPIRSTPSAMLWSTTLSTASVSLTTCCRVTALAERQWGLVTRAQLEQTGVARATLTRIVRAGLLQRVAHGVYLGGGAPAPDNLDLRAAWLQLAPEVPVLDRTADQGVVSHWSAAAIYGIGGRGPDRHEFLVPIRRQTRRPDVRLLVRDLAAAEWVRLGGLLVTRPARIAFDLLAARADPEEVGLIIAGALRVAVEYPWAFAKMLAPHAGRLGLRKGDGVAALQRLVYPEPLSRTTGGPRSALRSSP